MILLSAQVCLKEYRYTFKGGHSGEEMVASLLERFYS